MELLVPLVIGQILRIISYVAAIALISVVVNLIHQQFFYQRNEPPLVFHWFPFIGSTVAYGMDPYKFFFACREKHGDIFTFILLGKKITVYLGIEGNEFILNGKLKDVNAEEVYGKLTTPVFGSDVVYDCPNSKLMEQKKFVKFGLSQEALESYVPAIEEEVKQYIKTSGQFKGHTGTINLPTVMAEITIFTAGRTLQGPEAFLPSISCSPGPPLPHNRKRDIAHARMREIYLQIIHERRATGEQETKKDMIWNLMRCVYRDGHTIPDKEIAHMMITLLMAGQHSSSAISCWIMLRLASEPEMTEKLYAEQVQALGKDLPPLEFGHLEKLPLHAFVIKETLRIHSSIHTLMRKVKNPLSVPGTNYVIPTSHTLLSSPGVTARDEQFFKNAMTWDPHRWESRVEDDEGEGDTVDYGYGTVSKGTRSPYLPFGAGRHRCIGEKFAYLNLTVIVATLVREFRFFNPEDRVGVPETDYSSLFSRPVQPATVRWERRG
ncbi:transcriptional regulator family: Fungal Specific TF [Penicillium atrosanguineum]|uniref:transcriptional regulator family: Fungal Specific TF n=1 Tax=Penicillium atrosanguineum TaxID=1132637 RepID=UPI002383CD5E|nr:transcriptional regulator family: Fungal Specific TF [Penicillium atrosanguineum]KAJ5292980.1 transcriptional regulator family: Fungal Specific TF [Penicillium atrosanguineum]